MPAKEFQIVCGFAERFFGNEIETDRDWALTRRAASQGLTDDLALVTRDSNTVTLGGASSYTGATTVGGSKLLVNGSLGNTAVTVTAGTLGGSGSIAGSVTVNAGATLSPGNSIAVFSEGDTTFDGTSTFFYEVDSTNLSSFGSAADLLVVSGNVTITSGTVLNFADRNQPPQAFVEDTTIFAMINYTGSLTGTFNYNGTALADGSRLTVGSQMWRSTTTPLPAA